MNWLQRLIIGKELSRQLEQKAAFQPGIRYVIDNGRIVSPGDNKASYVKEGFSVNDIIYSVTKRILDKAILPEWKIYQVTDDSSLTKLRRSQMLMKSLSPQKNDVKTYKESLRLKAESLDELTSFNLQTGKLNDLLQFPNEEQSWQELMEMSCLFKLLTGDAYIFAELLQGGANQGIPNALDVLPSQFMQIKINNTFPARVSEYELFTWNQRFKTEEILHEKYPNPNHDINGQQLYGFAPLRAFLKNTARNNSAKDASSAKFQNGGMEEIIYFNDSNIAATNPMFAKDQMEALKIKLAEEYSGPANQGKIPVSAYPIGTAKLGLSPVELGIIDSEKWDAIMFCNGYNVPPELLGLTAKTFNNMIEAQKALILGAVMPLLDARRRALNRKLQTDWGFKGKNIYVDYETDCFPELEADVSKTMDWMNNLTMTKPNEERISVGLDALPISEADEVWVKTATGRVPLTDFQANIVDQTLSNGANSTNGGINGQGNQQNGQTAVSGNGSGKARVSNGVVVPKSNANGVSTKTH